MSVKAHLQITLPDFVCPSSRLVHAFMKRTCKAQVEVCRSLPNDQADSCGQCLGSLNCCKEPELQDRKVFLGQQTPTKFAKNEVNEVKNTKYNLVTFIPKFLWE